MAKQLLSIILLISIYSIGKAQITFQKTYNAGADDVGNCVQQTNDGGYVIAGYTTSGISGSNKNVLLMKTDKNGNIIWNQTYGGTSDEVATWAQQTSDNGYIICGNSGTNANNYGFLIKTNQYGDTLWTRTYYTQYNNFSYVEQTSDGGYVLSGNIKINTSFGSNYFGLVLKVDIYGNVLWSICNTSVFNNPNAFNSFNTVRQTSDDGYIVAGNIYDGNTNAPQSYLLKLNSAGDTVWSKDYTLGVTGSQSIINSVIQTNDLGYVFAAQTGYTGPPPSAPGSATIVKTDQLGNIVWQQNYNNANSATQIRQINSSNYVAILTSLYNVYNGNYVPNFYALKMDTGGNFKWSYLYQISPGLTSRPGNIQQTNDGGFIITGSNQDSTLDVYLIKADSNGVSNCNETPELMSSSNPNLNAQTIIVPNVSENTSIGNFSGIIDSLSYMATTLCDTNTAATGIEEIQNNNSFSVFPNPTNGQFTISLPSDDSEIIVTDFVGQEIIRAQSTQRVMNLQLQQNGVYMISVSDKDGTRTSKLVVNH